MRNIKIETRVWLESESGFSFGPGQAELLKHIKELGSLRKAAERMGMSYRRAWGRLKKMEETSGKTIVQKTGGNKLGFELAPFGEELAQRYEVWAEAVSACARDKADELLPKSLRPASKPGDD